ncbi:MAG: hypothetical protein R2851_08475 [Caldilineaceae bacterium]
MVGIVRFGIGPLFNIIHDVSATGMGVILGLMMLFMPKLNPHYMRASSTTSPGSSSADWSFLP